MYADLYSLILEEGKKQDLCELIAGYGHVYIQACEHLNFLFCTKTLTNEITHSET